MGLLPFRPLLPDPRPKGLCSRRVLVGRASLHHCSQTRVASGPLPRPTRPHDVCAPRHKAERILVLGWKSNHSLAEGLARL